MPRVMVVSTMTRSPAVRLRGELQRGGCDVTLANTPVEAHPHCAMWAPPRRRRGRTAVVHGWNLLDDGGRQTLAGPQRVAMESVIDTLRQQAPTGWWGDA
jgi:hypothetical protein